MGLYGFCLYLQLDDYLISHPFQSIYNHLVKSNLMPLIWLLACSLAVWSFKNLGLLYDRCPFFSIIDVVDEVLNGPEETKKTAKLYQIGYTQ
jgi:hypothetical protein